MRVAIYVRVSTQRQAQTQTIDQQLDRLRAVAAGRGWALPDDHVFRDDGYSGSSLRRPGLDRLRDLASLARLDVILVTDPDRLARNYVHQVLMLEELQRHGYRVEFADRPLSDDPHDQLLLQLRGAVAEYERTLIAERTRRGRLHKLRSGQLLPWTRTPYGYRVDPDRPRDPAGVRLEPAEAATVATARPTTTARAVNRNVGTGMNRLRRNGMSCKSAQPERPVEENCGGGQFADNWVKWGTEFDPRNEARERRSTLSS